MEFDNLLHQVSGLPIFSSKLLEVGEVDRANIQKQLSRWTTAKKVNQLRRGLYILAEPYRQIEPHPFLIANSLISPSYVSMQSALAYYDLIPETVPQVISMTSKFRSKVIESFSGSYRFHHLKDPYFSGFHLVQLDQDQFAYIARPEKALLDLIYLTKQGQTRAYLESLRLQNLDLLDLDWMKRTVAGWNSKKLFTAVELLSVMIKDNHLTQL
jgi:predicted transcriptional regulator of viral defense system